MTSSAVVVRSACALSLLLAIAIAPRRVVAGPADRVRPPDGWQLDADRASRLTPHLARDSHFGGAALDGSEVAVWSAPAGGAALIVSIVRAPAPADLPAAVRAELDGVRAASRSATIDGSAVHEDSWHEKATDGVAEATLVWRHAGHGTTSTSRTVIAARGDGIERATAECVVRDDLAATVGAACAQRLASLEPGIPAGQRVAITIGATAPAPSAAPAPGGLPDRAPPRLGDASGLSLPPMAIEQPRSRTDRRPLYVIGGLLLLGAAFLWNRGRQARLGTELGRRTRRDADREDPS